MGRSGHGSPHRADLPRARQRESLLSSKRVYDRGRQTHNDVAYRDLYVQLQDECDREGRRRRVGVIVVGRKSRQVYYTKDGTIFATNLDTRATKEIVKLPFRGGIASLNSDETLLLGSRNEN